MLRLLICLSALVAQGAVAAPLQIKTPGPVIYLADNLDEADELGWCIDTKGRGFSEQLHAHSCKPKGGDVQFAFDPDTGTIRSVAFADKCMTLVDPDDASIPFGLLDCKDDEASQQFIYDETEQEIHPEAESEKCVVAGESSRSAGPFMSRDLALQLCDDVDPELKRWIIKE